MPSNLNHLVSPTFAKNKQPESRYESKSGVQTGGKAANLMESKTQRAAKFDTAFQRSTTIDAEDLEPQISASMTTKNVHAKQFYRESKQSQVKTKGPQVDRKTSFGMTKS